MGPTERLPDGWIRKESTSRPNHFYYFNTKTGTTQWEKPNAKTKIETVNVDKSKIEENRSREKAIKRAKLDVSSKGHPELQKFAAKSQPEVRFKINDKSKDGEFT